MSASLKSCDDGAVTLTTALWLALIVSLLLLLFRFAVDARRHFEVTRMATMAAQAELARYDRTLHQTFGFFAAPMDGRAAQSALVHMDRSSRSTCVVEGQESLLNPLRLRLEVARQMHLRASTRLLASFVRRMTDLKGLKTKRPSVKTTIDKMTDTYDVNGLKRMITRLKGLPPERLRGLGKRIQRDIIDRYDRFITDLSPLRTYLSERGVNEGLVSKRTFERLGDKLDRVLTIRDDQVSSRLYDCEYALAYLHQATPTLIGRDRRPFDLKTPDGRLIKSFGDDRHYEVERLIIGGSPFKARLGVKACIYAMRLIIHLADNYRSPGKRAIWGATAFVLKGVITAVSFGTIHVPKAVLEFLLLMADAGVQSVGDMKRLMAGHKVAFWPKGRVHLYYIDYLRILLLAVPPETFAKRLAGLIEAACPGTYATAVTVRVSAYGHDVAVTSSYRRNTAGDRRAQTD